MKTEGLTFPEAYRFLSKSHREIFRQVSLHESPSVNEVEELTKIDEEVALYKYNDQWYAFRGSNLAIPLFLIPPLANTFLHTHPRFHQDEEFDPYMLTTPSSRDFLNARSNSKNLIASPYGLTTYSPPQSLRSKRILEAEVKGFNPRFTDLSTYSEYLEFLQEAELSFTVLPWNQVASDEFK